MRLNEIAAGIGSITVPDGVRATFISSVEGGMTVGLELYGPDGIVAGTLSLERCDLDMLMADMLGVTDSIRRRAAIDRGLDKAAQAELEREQRKRLNRMRRETVDHFQQTAGLTCAYCARTTHVIVDGKRYCKRHAEEHGVRAHGKVT